MKHIKSGASVGAIVSALMLAMAAVAGAQAAPAAGTAAPARTVESGETLVIDKTTRFGSLTIAPGATVMAAPGHSLTLVVDNVERDLAPGRYDGNVLLIPALETVVNFTDMGSHQVNRFRSAVYIDDGKYFGPRSIREASVGHSPKPVSDSFANGLSITSRGREFNGYVVTGKSDFTINDTVIDLEGNGRNDFDGLGAGIKVDGEANVTVNRAKIRSKGVVRTAIWVGGHATATINDSEIDVAGGTLPADYDYSWVNRGKRNDVMLEVPWLLGLHGTNRATLVEENASVTYNRSHIRAHDWGALSSDDPKGGIMLTANDCTVEVVHSGYGAYTVGNTLGTFNHTRFDVPDYAVIMASGTAVFTNGSVVNSRRFGAMAHGGASGGLTIDRGSVFNTDKAVIQLKSSSPDILVDGAQLHAKNGIILEAIVDDNPHKGHDGGGGGPPPPGSPVKVGLYNAMHKTKDIEATFRNVRLVGDVVHALTTQSDLNLHLANARITGAITTATSTHVRGPHGEELVLQDSSDLAYLIGEVTHDYAPTTDKHGLNLDLGRASRWEVSKASYLTSLKLAPGADVVAPKGYRLEVTVDGVRTVLKPGSYAGAIAIKPVRAGAPRRS